MSLLGKTLSSPWGETFWQTLTGASDTFLRLKPRGCGRNSCNSKVTSGFAGLGYKFPGRSKIHVHAIWKESASFRQHLPHLKLRTENLPQSPIWGAPPFPGNTQQHLGSLDPRSSLPCQTPGIPVKQQTHSWMNRETTQMTVQSCFFLQKQSAISRFTGLSGQNKAFRRPSWSHPQSH